MTWQNSSSISKYRNSHDMFKWEKITGNKVSIDISTSLQKYNIFYKERSIEKKKNQKKEEEKKKE
jgi:hypothetical protein